MPNLAEIHPVVWAPNPNKQTNKQTDRQASYIYYIDYQPVVLLPRRGGGAGGIAAAQGGGSPKE